MCANRKRSTGWSDHAVFVTLGMAGIRTGRKLHQSLRAWIVAAKPVLSVAAAGDTD